MGWEKQPIHPGTPYYVKFIDEKGKRRYLDHPEMPLRGLSWRPSTNIAAAWEVVEKLRNQHMELELSVVPKGAPAYPEDSQWLAGFHDDGPTNQMWGATAPHAICLAALAAVGVEA